ncbi:L,D-transpeptidase family protein [Pantoea sp. KPR_PJ]|uniref:L,D-transpeptidase family protein n=1 Tax=Pantoea sp. KPR_PJ TaxID=2738375 RepID=UPI003528C77F
MSRFLSFAVLISGLISQMACALTYPLPANGNYLVGRTLTITLPEGNRRPLEYYAAQYGTGLSNLLEANPGVDPLLPKGGTQLVIPQQIILPDAPRQGIVINSAETRLYYYPKGTNTVVVLPVGIGMINGITPVNWVTRVERKKAGPSWTPTRHERADYLKDGISLPATVGSGPQNPMGKYALYIGRQYAIHGTNADFGIGLRVSHGCIRLRDRDIEYLFNHVPVGTRVQFINQPVKLAREKDGSRWLEVHEPLSQTEADLASSEKLPLPVNPELLKAIQTGHSDPAIIDEAMNRRSGMPVKISRF